MEDRITPSTLVGLTTTNRLVLFDSANPTKVTQSVPVTGLSAGEDIVSIDARPADGLIYGLTNRNILYTVNPYSGAASRVSTPPASFLPLGSRRDIDFNPAVDRLRVVSNAEQNFRINPITGAIVDGDGGTGGIQPDTPLAYSTAVNPNIVAVAYDRNFQGGTLTTLFAIDHVLNTLVTVGGIDGVPSPNGGALSTVGVLGFNPGTRVTFDIAADGTAYSSFRPSNGAGPVVLYTINLTTGQATPVGKVGTGTTDLDSMTALPREEVVHAVTQSNRLVSFRAASPDKLLSTLPIQGLLVGENVTDIDFRPASGELFALTSTLRVLRIDPRTAQATQVGTPLSTSPQYTANSPGGFDFNPTLDRLRLVNSADNNLRFNPLTFAPVDSDANPANGNTPDTSLAYEAGDVNSGQDPTVVGVAYDRNDNDPGTPTTLWGIDSGRDTLVRIGGSDGTPSPNGGLLFTVGGNATGNLGVDVTDLAGFDILNNGTLGVGSALAVMQVQGETTSTLFSINLNASTTNQPQGSATRIGTVGGGELIRAMAISPPTVQFSQARFTVVERVPVATIFLTRTGGSGSVASVLFSALADSATAGDFTPVVNTVVTFQRGETTKTVTVPILNDARREAAETVLLTLSAPSTGVGGNTELGVLATATLSILNDD